MDDIYRDIPNIILPRRREFRVCVEDLNLRVLTTADSDSDSKPESLTGNHEHIHAYCEIFVCVSGEAILMIENEKNILTRGSIAVVPPGASHVCLSNVKNGWGSIGLLVSKRRVRGCEELYDQIASFLYCGNIRLFKDEELIAERLYGISTGADNDKLKVPLTVLTDLLALRESSRLPERQKTPSDKRNYDINQIAQLEQLVIVYYSHSITLAEAAEKLFISKSQLNRLVRQHYEMTFHKLISSLRVEAAARLLRDTDLSADKISTLVGFRTKSCFYKAFAEKYNVTPNAFRKTSLTCDKQGDNR